MRRAADPSMATPVTLAPGVHRPRRPQPCVDRTRLSTHPKQARYSTDYASICGTNIMRGTITLSHRVLAVLRRRAYEARRPSQVEDIVSHLWDTGAAAASRRIYGRRAPHPLSNPHDDRRVDERENA